MKSLGGWTRLGIVLTVLWTLVVVVELWVEIKQGPFSLGLLTETVVSKTGENASVLGGNAFRNLVPVDQVINIKSFLLALLVPIVSMWALGMAWAWVREGFHKSRRKK